MKKCKSGRCTKCLLVCWRIRFLSCHRSEILCIKLVGKTGVSITYFSENNEEQFAAVGNQERDDIVEFLGGQYQVVGYQIVSCEEVIECAIEFFETRQKSPKLKWEEL